MPALLLDHCVWQPTVEALRRGGVRCVLLREVGRAEAKNGEVLALAIKRRAALLTRDADFTNLSRYPLGRHYGIIYLRITPQTMLAVHRTLLLALRRTRPSEIRGALLIIEPAAYRLRRPLT